MAEYRFKSPSRGVKAPSFGGSGGQGGQNLLMGYILGQQKSGRAKETLGEGAVPVGGNVEGVQYETPQGLVMSGKKKIIEKALEDSARIKGLLPIVDELESRYRDLYPNAEVQKGLPGIGRAFGTLGSAVTQENTKAKSLLDQIEALGATFAKGLGDTGNIAKVEREDSIKAVAKLKYNLLDPLNFPDAPATGIQKFGDFRRLLLKKLKEVNDTVESGGEFIPEAYKENYPEFFGNTNQQESASPIPGSPGDVRTKYNMLRSSGLSPEEAKRRLGL